MQSFSLFRIAIALLVMCNSYGTLRDSLQDAARSPLNALSTNLKLIGDRSIVDRDNFIARLLIRVVSRSIPLGLAARETAIAYIGKVSLPINIASRSTTLGLVVGETAIAHISKAILPINKGFDQVLIQVRANVNEIK